MQRDQNEERMVVKVKQRLIKYLLSRKEEEGFTLVELVVVMAIMGFLAQLGVVSYQNSARRAVAVGAKTVVRNIKTECEMHRDLGMDEIFTLLTPDRYSIKTQDTNSCLGETSSGLVAAIPDNKSEYPSYFYDFNSGEIHCESDVATIFSDCGRSQQFKEKEFNSRKAKIEANDFVMKETYFERDC